MKSFFCRTLFTSVFLLLLWKSHAQKESNTWYFGFGTGLNFNTSPVSVLTDGQINTREGVCSISDKNGGLLFYSEGTMVWDRTHAVMPNGAGLLGDFSSTQSSIAVPNPGSASKYYLFTTALSQGMRYSEVDMTLNSGKGDIISGTKNTLLIPASSSSEKVIAVQHCNRKDYWVISHTLFSTSFYVYLVNASGIQAPIVINIGSYTGDGVGWEGVGYLKLSADGSRLVNVMGPPILGAGGKAEVFNFNNRTGIIGGPVVSIAPLTFPYGAEFSLANKFLYISDISENRIFQFDLLAANVAASKTVVAASPNISYGALQMAPDARIYVSGENGYSKGYGFMSIIEKPDLKAPQCNFLEDAINLNGKLSLIGLPTFAASFLKKDTSIISYSAGCVSVGGLFTLSNTNNADSVTWDFGDGSPLSTQFSPSHAYATAGVYNTKTIIYRSCNANDTIIKPITIRPSYSVTNNATVCQGSAYTLPDGTKVYTAGSFPVTLASVHGCDSVVTTVLTIAPAPKVNLGNDTSLCSGKSITLNAGIGFTSYSWQNASAAQTISANVPGLYWVEVTTPGVGCVARDSIVISAAPSLSFSLGRDTLLCTGQNMTIGNVVAGANTYLWNTGSVNPQISVASPGLYWLEAVSAAGCPARDSLLVQKNPVIDVNLGPDSSICQGQTRTIGSAVNGASYLWNTGETTSQINLNSGGLYWQEVSLAGCTRRDSVDISLKASPLVKAQKTNDIDCGTPTAQLSASGANQYNWSPAAGLNNPSVANPIASINTTTTFLLKGTDGFGCSATDTVTVQVGIGGSARFDVPNAFSPNGDGYNDCFGISKWGAVQLIEFAVYNRFGQKVFSTTNPVNCWDGNFKGKKQDPGGFVYIIKAKTFCADIFRKGIVMLLR